MATFKEALTTSLTNFAKSIAKTYSKTADIVDNLLSTDSTLPLSAKQGNVLQTQIDALNSNKVFTKSATQKLGEITSLADADQFAGKTGIVYLNLAGNYCEILCICLLNTTLQFRQAVFANKLYIRSSYKDTSTLSTLWTDWKELI